MERYSKKDYEKDSSIKTILIKGAYPIENGEFMCLENIEKIIISDKVEIIGNNAFSSCKKLEKVNFPKSLKEIGLGAFHGCSNLQSVILPDSIQSIGWGAFENCCSLKEISLPISVKIGYNAFKNLSNDAIVKFRFNDVRKVASIDLYDKDLFNNIYLSKDNKKIFFAKKEVPKLEKNCFKLEKSSLDIALDSNLREWYVASRRNKDKGLEK